MGQVPLDRVLASVLIAQLDGAARPGLLSLVSGEDGAPAAPLPLHEVPAAGRS